jgi:hydrogenase maturation protease
MVLDAINNDCEPGTILRLEGDEAPAMWQQKLSVHQAGVSDMLALLRIQDMMPERLVVWGVQPKTIDWNLELSAPVAASLETLVAKVAEELKAWGALAD